MMRTDRPAATLDLARWRGDAPGMAPALIETLPPAHRLALAYAPRRARGPTLALLALDARLAGIVRQQGEPIIAQMKLGWWRERFSQPPSGWPAGEPLLAELATLGTSAQYLGVMVDGWEALLAEVLDPPSVEAFAAGRAGGWLAVADRIAPRADREAVSRSASDWALADLAVNLTDPGERQLALTRIGAVHQTRMDPALRPLVVLRGLALRAAQRGARTVVDGPGAALTALRLGFSGR